MVILDLLGGSTGKMQGGTTFLKAAFWVLTTLEPSIVPSHFQLEVRFARQMGRRGWHFTASIC